MREKAAAAAAAANKATVDELRPVGSAGEPSRVRRS
jgi:hypothetical protein